MWNTACLSCLERPKFGSALPGLLASHGLKINQHVIAQAVLRTAAEKKLLRLGLIEIRAHLLEHKLITEEDYAMVYSELLAIEKDSNISIEMMQLHQISCHM